MESPLRITLQINESDKSSFLLLRVSWRQYFIIVHPLQITSQSTQSHQRSVAVSRWFGKTVSSSNILFRSYYRSHSLTRIVLPYRDELETLFHHQISSWNHITNPWLWSEFCCSLEMSLRQCYIVEHLFQITLEINQFQKSSVGVLRWIGNTFFIIKHPLRITS